MKRYLCLTLLPLILTASFDAMAKRSSHASTHTSSSHSSGTHPHSPETHTSSSSDHGVSGVLRHARGGRESEAPTTVSSTAEAVAKQEKAAADQRAQAEAIAARKLEQAVADEQRRVESERAAKAAEESRKAQAAEARQQEREQAAEARRQKQAAWEARCQIKPVMTDDEIATCREAWTTAAR